MLSLCLIFFFFNDTATTEIYTLSLHDALPIWIQQEIIERDLYATAVLSGNRNFDGRIHPYAKQAFLASPPLVVAYAIAGTIRFDIERDAFGTDTNGKPITLQDLWPSDEEIDAIVKASVKPEQ